MAASDPSLKAYVLRALRDVVSVQFAFRIQDIDVPVAVTTSSLGSVASAIQQDRITVRPMSEYKGVAGAGAAYSNDNDTIYVPADYVNRSPGDQRTYEMGTIIHEGTHAHFDLIAAQHLTHATGEVGAYLVAALYYEARHYAAKPANDTFTLTLIEAARLTSKVRTPGVTLKRPDFASLRAAIVTHYKRLKPSYRGDTIMPGLGVRAP